MRDSLTVVFVSCVLGVSAWAGDKPFEVKPGDAIPAKIITTSHLGPFKHDLPAVLPMVVVSFQTQAADKGSGSGFFGSSGIQYTLSGISNDVMQKTADEAQAAIEAELKAGGWQILPADKFTELEAYKSWIKSPETSGEEVKRSFFSAGKGTNTFSSKEMERVFVGGNRPLVGNSMVLGGWTAASSLCQIGKALDAKVIVFRAIVNFANIHAGKNGLFSGQEWKGSTTLEISYAEMDVYPPDAKGATPARLTTDNPVTVHSEFVKDVQKSKSDRTIVADPARYASDTVEAIRAVAKGFVAESSK
jgi:hypothetical protein